MFWPQENWFGWACNDCVRELPVSPCTCETRILLKVRGFEGRSWLYFYFGISCSCCFEIQKGWRSCREGGGTLNRVVREICIIWSAFWMLHHQNMLKLCYGEWLEYHVLFWFWMESNRWVKSAILCPRLWFSFDSLFYCTRVLKLSILSRFIRIFNELFSVEIN